MNTREKIGDYETLAAIIMNSLTSFVEDESFSTIYSYAFKGNINLISIDMPHLEKISGEGFVNCDALVSAKFASATQIYSQAFRVDRALEEVYFPNVTVTSNEAFAYCSKITEINMPVLRSIGSSSFSYCTALEKVYIPSINDIGSYVFNNCTSLKKIDLNNVSSIGSNVFTYSGLETVILRNTSTVCSLASYNSFSGLNSLSIYVPDNLVDSYKEATNWSTFADRIKPLSELPAEEEES